MKRIAGIKIMSRYMLTVKSARIMRPYRQMCITAMNMPMLLTKMIESFTRKAPMSAKKSPDHAENCVCENCHGSHEANQHDKDVILSDSKKHGAMTGGKSRLFSFFIRIRCIKPSQRAVMPKNAPASPSPNERIRSPHRIQTPVYVFHLLICSNSHTPIPFQLERDALPMTLPISRYTVIPNP